MLNSIFKLTEFVLGFRHLFDKFFL